MHGREREREREREACTKLSLSLLFLLLFLLLDVTKVVPPPPPLLFPSFFPVPYRLPSRAGRGSPLLSLARGTKTRDARRRVIPGTH